MTITSITCHFIPLVKKEEWERRAGVTDSSPMILSSWWVTVNLVLNRCLLTLIYDAKQRSNVQSVQVGPGNMFRVSQDRPIFLDVRPITKEHEKRIDSEEYSPINMIWGISRHDQSCQQADQESQTDNTISTESRCSFSDVQFERDIRLKVIKPLFSLGKRRWTFIYYYYYFFGADEKISSRS